MVIALNFASFSISEDYESTGVLLTGNVDARKVKVVVVNDKDNTIFDEGSPYVAMVEGDVTTLVIQESYLQYIDDETDSESEARFISGVLVGVALKTALSTRRK